MPSSAKICRPPKSNMELEKNLSKSGRLKQTLAWYYGFTSIGGLVQIRESKNPCSKLFWGLLFAVGMVLTIYGVLTCIKEYLDCKTYTAQSLARVTESRSFPAVTICNANRIHCGHLIEVVKNCTENKEKCSRLGIYCQLFILTQCGISLSLKETSGKGNVNLSGICSDFVHPRPKDIDDAALYDKNPAFYTPAEDASEIETTFQKLLSQLNMDELLNLSHHPSSLIQQCDMGISYYNGSASECQDLRSFGGTPFISLRNGVCYSFNFRGVSHPRGEIREAITSSYPGSSYGLRLVIKLEGSMYMRNSLTRGKGAYIVLQHPRRIASIQNEGILVKPGTETNVAVLATRIRRLPSPYPSDCIEDYPEQFRKHLKGVNLIYDQHKCLNLNTRDSTEEICNCQSEKGFEGDVLTEDWVNFKFCEVNETTKDCPWQLLKSFGKTTESSMLGVGITVCKPECEYLKYKPVVSTMDWPQEDYGLRLANDDRTYSNKIIDLLNNDENQKNLRSSDTLKVNVFFQDNNEELIQEVKQFSDVFSFLNALGGALALWLGISLISAFECVEWSVRIIASLCSLPSPKTYSIDVEKESHTSDLRNSSSHQ